jgi:hypothetical protein
MSVTCVTKKSKPSSITNLSNTNSNYTRENKCEQLLAKREKSDYTQPDKHIVIAHKKYQY